MNCSCYSPRHAENRGLYLRQCNGLLLVPCRFQDLAIHQSVNICVAHIRGIRTMRSYNKQVASSMKHAHKIPNLTALRDGSDVSPFCRTAPPIPGPPPNGVTESSRHILPFRRTFSRNAEMGLEKRRIA